VTFILDAPPWNDFLTFKERLGLFAAMRFHGTDDDIDAIALSGAGRVEHFVCLADARRRTHENLEFADAALLSSRSFEERLRRGSMFAIAPLIHHH
jgi:hypothetical protein